MNDGRQKATLEESDNWIDLGDLTEEHPYLKPIFRTRQQLLNYDCLVNLKCILAELTDLKIKKNNILGQVGLKFAKLLLSYFCKERLDLKTGVGTETRLKLL